MQIVKAIHIGALLLVIQRSCTYVHAYGYSKGYTSNTNAKRNGSTADAAAAATFSRTTSKSRSKRVALLVPTESIEEGVSSSSSSSIAGSTMEEDVDASMLDYVSALGLPSLRDASAVDVHTKNSISNVEFQLQQEALRRRQVKVASQQQQQPRRTRSRRLMGSKAIPDVLEGSNTRTFAAEKVRERLKISSHEEEIELARAIQLGAKVNIMKTEMEQKLNRPITKTEWAEIAQVGSASQLRRIVSDYRKAKNKLVMANLGLVHAVVKGNRFASTGGQRQFGNSASYEELVQEGSLGLLRAAELFDPERGLRFSTYATIWIKGVLSNTKVHELITTPTRERTKVNKIREASNSLVEMNEEVTNDKIAEITGYSAEEIELSQVRTSQTSSPLSLDYSYSSSDSKGDNKEVSLYGDAALMDHNNAAALVEFQTDVLTVLTNNLKPREAEFICLRYGIKDGNALTLNECAERMGISYSRAQQLAKSCIKKLQEAEDAKTLQEYLLTLS